MAKLQTQLQINKIIILYYTRTYRIIDNIYNMTYDIGIDGCACASQLL